MQHGKLILVSGYSGAGKTTLVRAAIQAIPTLRYLTTTTTRPKRSNEDSIEYEFVTSNEYDRRRHHSKQWDHTEFAGSMYGADVDAANQLLESGTNLICCVAPDEATVNQMASLYSVKPIVIWIDTPLAIANQRLAVSGDTVRANRHQQPLNQDLVDTTFAPKQNLADDIASFVELLKQVMMTT